METVNQSFAPRTTFDFVTNDVWMYVCECVLCVGSCLSTIASTFLWRRFLFNWFRSTAGISNIVLANIHSAYTQYAYDDTQHRVNKHRCATVDICFLRIDYWYLWLWIRCSCSGNRIASTRNGSIYFILHRRLLITNDKLHTKLTVFAIGTISAIRPRSAIAAIFTIQSISAGSAYDTIE